MNANVGMLHPVFSPISAYTPGTGVTYGTGKVIAEAVSASLNWDRADGEFYGDDALLDTDNGILGYTIEFEPSGLSDEARQTMLGETVSSAEYTVTNTPSPDGGFGYVRVMRATGTGGVANSYEGWWFYKVKFSVTSEETRTNERNVEWRTPTLTGRGAGVQLSSGDTLSYACHKTFNTAAAAIAYVNGKAGIT